MPQIFSSKPGLVALLDRRGSSVLGFSMKNHKPPKCYSLAISLLVDAALFIQCHETEYCFDSFSSNQVRPTEH